MLGESEQTLPKPSLGDEFFFFVKGMSTRGFGTEIGDLELVVGKRLGDLGEEIFCSVKNRIFKFNKT